MKPDTSLFDAAFDAEPGAEARVVRPASRSSRSPTSRSDRRQEFTISSAGFWVQHATSEWLLTRRPHLRDRARPVRQGRARMERARPRSPTAAPRSRVPARRNATRAAWPSRSALPKPWIGALVLAPAVLDTVRYARPQAAGRGGRRARLKIGCAAGRRSSLDNSVPIRNRLGRTQHMRAQCGLDTVRELGG